MKVVVIAPSLHNRSGWGRYACAVIDQLMAQGMEVSVCSETKGDVSYPVHVISALSVHGFAFALIRNTIMIRRLARDADIIHAFDGWPYSVYGWLAVLGTRKKLFVSGIATYSVLPHGASLKRWLFAHAYARTVKILCVSDFTRDRIRLSGVPSEKFVTIHMGATPLPFLEQVEKEDLASRYQIAPDVYPVILTVGEIKDRKGQFETLRAVLLLRDIYPHVLYVMAAAHKNDVYVAEMQSFIEAHNAQHNVMFVHDADDRALSFLYARSDIVALNSNTDDTDLHFEGFGLSVLEGYQFGKPAVGSRGSGVQEAIQDGKTGLVTRQADPADIAEKIKSILADYKRFSDAAKEAYQSFTWEKTVAAFIQEYKR